MGKTIAGQVLDVSFTITDNATATPDIDMQFSDLAGNDVSHPVCAICYFSTDANGQALAVDSTDLTEIAIHTNGTILSELVTDVAPVCISEADGELGLTPTMVNGKSVYLNVVMPNGEIKHSTVITGASG